MMSRPGPVRRQTGLLARIPRTLRAWGPRRWWWCTKQRSHLRAPDRQVVWVRDAEKVPWALWGADNGFFVLEWAGRLPFLRAAAPSR